MTVYDKTIVIITGQLNFMFVDNLLESYKDVTHKMVSTWADQDEELLNILSLNNFNILRNDYPSYINSTNVQIHSTRMGLLEAQRLGFKYICHTRTDVFPLNYRDFLDSCAHLYTEKPSVLCGIPTNVYFMDILVAGPIDKMLQFYNKLQERGDTRGPETYLLEEYLGKRNLTKDAVKSSLNICLNVCRQRGIEFIWVRPAWWAIGCRTIPMMKVIAEYCGESAVYE